MDQQLWCQSPGNSGARPIFFASDRPIWFLPGTSPRAPEKSVTISSSRSVEGLCSVWTGLELTAKLGLFVGIQLVPLVYLIHLRMEWRTLAATLELCESLIGSLSLSLSLCLFLCRYNKNNNKIHLGSPGVVIPGIFAGKCTLDLVFGGKVARKSTTRLWFSRKHPGALVNSGW